jgi:hypothetical protein
MIKVRQHSRSTKGKGNTTVRSHNRKSNKARNKAFALKNSTGRFNMGGGERGNLQAARIEGRMTDAKNLQGKITEKGGYMAANAQGSSLGNTKEITKNLIGDKMHRIDQAFKKTGRQKDLKKSWKNLLKTRAKGNSNYWE